jgi:hypothetical protein
VRTQQGSTPTQSPDSSRVPSSPEQQHQHQQQSSPPTSSSSSSAHSSSPPAQPAQVLHRVKVYRLTEPDAWQDLGTGRCGIRTSLPDQDEDHGPWIVVLEEEPSSPTSPGSSPPKSSQGNVIFHCSMRAVFQKAAQAASLALRKASDAAEIDEWKGMRGLEKGGAFARQQGACLLQSTLWRLLTRVVCRHAYRMERPEWKGHGSQFRQSTWLRRDLGVCRAGALSHFRGQR